MSESIDNLFKRSRYQKRISISDSLWRRVELKLERRKSAKRRRNFFYLAACITFLIIVMGSVSALSTTYTLEDQLVSSPSFAFSKEDISFVNTLYASLPPQNG